MSSVADPIERLEQLNKEKKKRLKYIKEISKQKKEKGYSVDFTKHLRSRNGTLNNQNTFLKPNITCY
jgi:uncharacterized protein (UPF0335 family)